MSSNDLARAGRLVRYGGGTENRVFVTCEFFFSDDPNRLYWRGGAANPIIVDYSRYILFTSHFNKFVLNRPTLTAKMKPVIF